MIKERFDRWAASIGVTVCAFIIAALIFPWLTTNTARMWGNFWSVAGKTHEEWAGLLTPNSGTWLHHDKVRVALRLIQENDLKDFRLTENWKADAYLNQRMTEAAYPVLHQFNSKNLVGHLDETPKKCNLRRGYYLAKDPKYGVAFSRCP